MEIGQVNYYGNRSSDTNRDGWHLWHAAPVDIGSAFPTHSHTHMHHVFMHLHACFYCTSLTFNVIQLQFINKASLNNRNDQLLSLLRLIRHGRKSINFCNPFIVLVLLWAWSVWLTMNLASFWGRQINVQRKLGV